MPFGTGLAVAVGVSLLGVGAWRLYAFLAAIRQYRESPMAATVSITDSRWLQLASGVPARPLEFFRINDEVMGGKSTSTLSFDDSSFFAPRGLLFAGTINTKSPDGVNTQDMCCVDSCATWGGTNDCNDFFAEPHMIMYDAAALLR